MQAVRRRSDQAAWFAGPWKASMPSGNPTPAMTLGFWFVLFSRHDLVAARFRLRAIGLAVASMTVRFRAHLTLSNTA
jgi:hypothetical protein